MELKPGYKQTEIGVIPEDWIVKPLGELGQFKNGINKGKEDFGHGFPFINLMDVFGIPKVSTLTTEFGLVNTTTAEQDLYELKGGDVLFVRSSVKPEGVGLTALIPKDLPHTVFSGFLIRFRDSGLLELGFKEHCFWAFKRNRLFDHWVNKFSILLWFIRLVIIEKQCQRFPLKKKVKKKRFVSTCPAQMRKKLF